MALLQRVEGLEILGTPSGVIIIDRHNRRRWSGELLQSRIAAAALSLSSDPQTHGELVRKVAQETSSNVKEVARVITELGEAGMLRGPEEEERGAAAPIETWRAHNWGAAFQFHQYTSQIPMLDYAEPSAYRADARRMRDYVQRAQPPSLYTDRIGARLSLPSCHSIFPSTSVHKVFDTSSADSKPDKPFGTSQLSAFCELAFGETGRIRLPATGEHLLKTAPSGGSRHPTEAYLLILDASGLADEGIPSGAYHYSVRDHTLVCVASGDFTDLANRQCIVHVERLTFVPKIVFVLTSVFARSMYRYRESRTYRVISNDIGHVLEGASMVASTFGLNTYRTYTPREQELESLLEIDGFDEAVMASISVG